MENKEAKGIALVVPALWGETSLGKVTAVGDIEATGIRISMSDEVRGNIIPLQAILEPVNATQDVEWSITSGGDYTSISNGNLIINETANGESVTIKAKVVGTNISDTKVVNVYYASISPIRYTYESFKNGDDGASLDEGRGYIPSTNKTGARDGIFVALIDIPEGATKVNILKCIITTNTYGWGVRKPIPEGELVGDKVAGAVYMTRERETIDLRDAISQGGTVFCYTYYIPGREMFDAEPFDYIEFF